MNLNLEILKGKKILLVEDDKFFSKIIEGKLTKVGCEFSHALSGEESLKMIEKSAPDAIILDILLPGGIDGFEVLEKIKKVESLKKIPVIILSNLGQPTDIEKGMKLGAFRYLVKASVAPEDIAAHIASALGTTTK